MKTIGRDFGDVARKVYATASGTLPNGKPVVVNSDGTVSVVSPSGNPPALGTPAVFESAATYFIFSCNPRTNMIVVAYTDGGDANKGKAVVGTISGSSISFGTPVEFGPTYSYCAGCVIDPQGSGSVIILYRKVSNPDSLIARAGTTANGSTNISFGSTKTITNNTTSFESMGNDMSRLKTIIAYRDEGDGNKGKVVVLAVSGGTTLTTGTTINFTSNGIFNTSIAWVIGSTGKNVLAYRHSDNSNYGTAVVVSITSAAAGNAISVGTPVVFNSATTLLPSVSSVDQAVGNDFTVVIAYADGGNNNYGTAIVGYVAAASGTGTVISFPSSEVVFTSSAVDNIVSVTDTVSYQNVIAYKDVGNSNYGTFLSGTVTGTSISFTSPTVFSSATSTYNSLVFEPQANKTVISYQDPNNSNYGKSVVTTSSSTNLTAENYVGMTPSAYPDGAGAEIDTKGAINTEQSGLTAGQSYYVQTDGTITTTAGTPSVFAGTAVSATKLIVKG